MIYKIFGSIIRDILWIIIIYINIVYLHKNINIFDYIVDILLKKTIYMIYNLIVGIIKYVIYKKYIIV